MTLNLRTDPAHPGGGFALLEGAGLVGVSSITVENGFSGQFLGEEGLWGRHACALPVEGTPGGLSLGPHIVDHVPTELQVELRTGEGRRLGRIIWTDVIPSRALVSVTSAQMLATRRAEQQVAEQIAAAARENIAAREAETRSAKEQTERESVTRDAAESIGVVAATEDAPTAGTSRAPLAAAVAPKRSLNVPKVAAEAVLVRHYDDYPNWTFVVVIAVAVGFFAWVSARGSAPDLATDLGRLARLAWFRGPASAVAQQPSVSAAGGGCQLMSSAEEWRSGDWSAQIAVAANRVDAEAACMKLHQRFGKLYFDMPHISVLEFQGTRMYSVRLSGNLDRARSLCRFITLDGGACSVVRSRVSS